MGVKNDPRILRYIREEFRMGVKIDSRMGVKIDPRILRYIRKKSRMGVKIDSRMRFLETRMATKLVTVPIPSINSYIA
jgi:hypothetical protein